MVVIRKVTKTELLDILASRDGIPLGYIPTATKKRFYAISMRGMGADYEVVYVEWT